MPAGLCGISGMADPDAQDSRLEEAAVELPFVLERDRGTDGSEAFYRVGRPVAGADDICVRDARCGMREDAGFWMLDAG